MQQIVLKREFSVLFNTAKIENVQYLEGKIQPIKKMSLKKLKRKKKSLKI